jgi:hypothetical protein
MTKRTPAPAEAGPVAPDESDQDALLRRMMDDVLAQPPSEREVDLADRLATVVTERLTDAAVSKTNTTKVTGDLAPKRPGEAAGGERPESH